MTTAGDVIAKINGGGVVDLAGNSNVASTSTDNKVTWSPAVGNNTPTVTIDSPAFGTTYAKGNGRDHPLLKASLHRSGQRPVDVHDQLGRRHGELDAARSTTSGQNFQATHSFPNSGRLHDQRLRQGQPGRQRLFARSGSSSTTRTAGSSPAAGSSTSAPARTRPTRRSAAVRTSASTRSTRRARRCRPARPSSTSRSGTSTSTATSYSWLVVSGCKAQYKGTGTVNGVSGYDFTLTAYDGEITGGGGVDKFRIVITERNHGNGVSSTTGTACRPTWTRPIRRRSPAASIVIHKA